jgi:poly-gamma-glutamate capsule biosynthesis protein CapA/YwtB (metallophosphatase superfamily)
MSDARRADLVVGSGPHVLQGIERLYKDRVIAYSLGNLAGLATTSPPAAACR